MAGDYRNRSGGVYALTTFASILPGHVDEVQAYIDNLPLGAPVLQVADHQHRDARFF